MVHVNLSPAPPVRYAPPAIPENRPAYEVIAEKGFFSEDDELLKQGTIIVFDGTPSLGLKPLNDKAKKIMIKYIEELDRLGKEKAAIDKRGYTRHPSVAQAAQWMEELEQGGTQVLGRKTNRNILGRKPQRKKKVQTIEQTTAVASAPIKEASKGRDTVNGVQDPGI